MAYKMLLDHGLIPSSFFRFPGLVSDGRLIEQLRDHSFSRKQRLARQRRGAQSGERHPAKTKVWNMFKKHCFRFSPKRQNMGFQTFHEFSPSGSSEAAGS